MNWKHLILPHQDTHEKAHLISWHGLSIYILLFILLQTFFSILGYAKPGILGTTSSITVQQVIELTNKEREKLGLRPLSENSELDQAAKAKAGNMFSENYWAHFAPSGKTPWDFITSSGYRFSFAGENLAKNFTNNEDVVKAWMNSPTHKENLLNSKYKDIGIAVEDGVLNGQRTTLVVQMFGTTGNFISDQGVKLSSSSINVSGITNVTTRPLFDPLFDPFIISKTYAAGILTLVLGLLALDLIVLKR
ncbi:hypothetical protein HYT18_05365, partial [Candidatus Microgenomates bacterium]|nr:hypothetical protein [Candidatus Microgenomates bacterium]